MHFIGHLENMSTHFIIQEYLGDTVGSVPDHYNKASRNLFAGREFCLEFVKNATTVKHSKAQYNKMRYACTISKKSYLLISLPVASETCQSHSGGQKFSKVQIFA